MLHGDCREGEPIGRRRVPPVEFDDVLSAPSLEGLTQPGRNEEERLLDLPLQEFADRSLVEVVVVVV